MYMGQKERRGTGKSAHQSNGASNSYTIAAGRIIHGQSSTKENRAFRALFRHIWNNFA
jgi:hypothetical protein